MSSPLAIAGVTAVLKDLLNNGVIAHDLATTLGMVKVTARAPDRISTGGQGGGREETQLNLFLHHVSLNAAWRNTDLPSRDARGDRIANPPLALDLHYLLTAYGSEDLHAEILLGYAMQLMHETPILTRQAIRTALSPPSAPVSGSGILPASYPGFAATDLADQLEMIRITPETLSTEDMSKLWAAFQTHYRPSAAYCASVVLIENPKPARAPLPVLTRGKFDPVTKRDEGIKVQPDLLPAYPTVLALVPPDQQTAVVMGDDLVVKGHHLSGDVVSVRFTHLPSSDTLILNAPTGQPDQFSIHIPDDPAQVAVPVGSPLNPENWRAGHFTVATSSQTGTDAPRISNVVPLMLAPRIRANPPISVTTTATDITIVVRCSPKVWRGQRVSLVIGDKELAAQAFAAAKSDTLTFTAPRSAVSSGSQPVRLRVDGVESILVDRTGPVPVFDASQKVNIP